MTPAQPLLGGILRGKIKLLVSSEQRAQPHEQKSVSWEHTEKAAEARILSRPHLLLLIQNSLLGFQISTQWRQRLLNAATYRAILPVVYTCCKKTGSHPNLPEIVKQKARGLQSGALYVWKTTGNKFNSTIFVAPKTIQTYLVANYNSTPLQ